MIDCNWTGMHCLLGRKLAGWDCIMTNQAILE